MNPHLVYDVGMNNGDDTAYYLRRGYRVVGIEANPEFADACVRRFDAEIRAGRVTVLNVAITPDDGSATFFVSEINRGVWSSLREDLAARGANSASAVTVPARRFKGILCEYGVPYYLKVDIEGADWYCLRDIDPADAPAYVSFEASEGRLQDLYWLATIGYTRFKLIDQLAGFRQATAPPMHSWALVQATVSKLTRQQLRGLPGLGSLRRLVRSPRSSTHHQSPAAPAEFRVSSSGPMAEETDGSWCSLDEVTYNWLYHVRHTTTSNWYDVHAAR